MLAVATEKVKYSVSVNTKVDLRFHVLSAEWISEDVRQKILQRVRLKGL